MTNTTLGSYWRFLLAGLFNQGQTGAVVPSQRFLIDRMIEPIPAGYRGHILELGSGTGVLTRRLAARCSQARVIACEINADLAIATEKSLTTAGLRSRVEVISDAAEQVLSWIVRGGMKQPEFIVSGIPLGNLGREPVLAIINGVHSALAQRGLYIQFQHSLLDRKKIKNRFSRLRTIPVFLNFPPAVVYYAQK
jgi:phospholipid N-methyltransferase